MRPLLMRVDWRRIVGEGLVIIASMLLALWIDARVEQRHYAALERDYLRSLETDLREDSVALTQTLTNARQRVTAGGALLPVVAGEAAPGPEFIADLMRLGNMEESRQVALTVDELRDTGRMSLIGITRAMLGAEGRALSS